MQTIKAVIFDLDGTLADTLPLCIEAFRRSVEPLIKRSLPDEEIIATFGPSEEGTIMALAPQHYEKAVAGYLANYQNMHAMCPHVFDGIPELLTLLTASDIKLAVVTGKGKHSTEISLNYLRIKDFFEIIETGSPAGPVKAQGIQSVLNEWHTIGKDEVLYVGDTVSDIEASRKVGVPVIAAAWAKTADAESVKLHNPDEFFYSVVDFSTWISARL